MKRFFVLIPFLFVFINLFAQSSIVKYKNLNINNISTLFWNTGESDQGYNDDKFKYPKDNLINTGFYFSGFLWGGIVDKEIRVSGTTFSSRLQPSGDKQIYRVRPDWQNGDISSEINDNEGSENEIREEYEQNWNNWPGNNGAPFKDVNNNGVYEPEIDLPGIPGADQTIWFVANDFDSALVDPYYKYSEPLGIELESTSWAYNQLPPLGNIIFRKYKIINRSNKVIKDMYCSITTDPDIGDVTDDYVGCDTTLNLAYCYNWDADDIIFGATPPAVGYVLLKGPTVNDEDLNLSSFNFIINADPIYGYPRTANDFYNQFKGLVNSGESKYEIPADYGGGYTAFPFSGDPIAGTGWRDGIIHPPGNRNMNLSTGPFDLAPQEFQEVVFAQIAAGGINNISRLEAIDSLKNYSLDAKIFFETIRDQITNIEFETSAIGKSYELYSNYPNPFNPSTTIKYSIPQTSNVSLNIYDILGNEIKSFEYNDLSVGLHSTFWDGTSNNGVLVSSGVYIYKFRAVSLSGNGEVYEKSNKLMMLK